MRFLEDFLVRRLLGSAFFHDVVGRVHHANQHGLGRHVREELLSQAGFRPRPKHNTIESQEPEWIKELEAQLNKPDMPPEQLSDTSKTSVASGETRAKSGRG